MSDGRLRLFVALALPAPIRNELVRWRERFGTDSNPRLRPMSPEALHVTLCFLGWQPQAAVDRIAAACGVLRSETPVPLALGGAVWLPRRQPRVLAVELSDPEGALVRAQSRLSAALSEGGWYQPERRPYLAHVTVARVAGRPTSVKRGSPLARAASAVQKLTPPSRLEFRGSDVVLYRSRLQRGGAQYEALGRVELAG